nr:hypothetical protein [Tanacetum cinerariifolium]
MKKKDQISFDKKEARRLQAELDQEQRLKQRLAEEKVQKVLEANIVVIEQWHAVQAKIEVDFELAQRLQAEEQEQLTDDEKNMDGWKPRALKNKSFAENKELFDKEMTRINNFVDFRTELVEESSKKVEESTSKRARDKLEITVDGIDEIRITNLGSLVSSQYEKERDNLKRLNTFQSHGFYLRSVMPKRRNFLFKSSLREFNSRHPGAKIPSHISRSLHLEDPEHIHEIPDQLPFSKRKNIVKYFKIGKIFNVLSERNIMFIWNNNFRDIVFLGGYLEESSIPISSTEFTLYEALAKKQAPFGVSDDMSRTYTSFLLDKSSIDICKVKGLSMIGIPQSLREGKVTLTWVLSTYLRSDSSVPDTKLILYLLQDKLTLRDKSLDLSAFKASFTENRFTKCQSLSYRLRLSILKRLETIFGRHVNREHILDFKGLTPDIRQDLAERIRMVYTGDDGQEDRGWDRVRCGWHAEGRKSGARLSKGDFIRCLAHHFGLVSDDGLRGLFVVTREILLINMENGNSFKPVLRITANAYGTSTSTVSGPVTVEEKAQKKNYVKARSIFLMALPNEHLLTFSQYKDAKTLFEVIQAKFSESLDSIFNRLQKIVSQLAILGENISQEDLNMKFLRSLSAYGILMCTNEVDTASIQVGTTNTLVSTISSPNNTTNLSYATVYAFLANKPNGSQLVHKDIEQIHKDDLEEMDLKWQLALLSMRARRYFQKISKNITISGSDTAGYDKTKVECFNCHKIGYFVRECKSLRNQESRPRNQDSSRKSMIVEDTSSKAMVAIDGAGFDWSYLGDDEVPTNMALMAFSDSEVHNSKTYSNTYLKSFKTLKNQYDNLRIELNKYEFDLANYKRGLAFVEEQLVFYKNNEVAFYDQIAVLKRDASFRESDIIALNLQLEKLKKEK